MMGKRPTNSGMRPYWIKSVCSTWRRTFEDTLACPLPRTLALQRATQPASATVILRHTFPRSRAVPARSRREDYLTGFPKPMDDCAVRSATCRSKSMKAPPQMNRMLVVSTWTHCKSLSTLQYELKSSCPSVMPCYSFAVLLRLRLISSARKAAAQAARLQEVAAGVLAAALLGHVHDGALQHLQQRLLHPLPAHVPRDADILALLHNLINLQHQQWFSAAAISVLDIHIQRCKMSSATNLSGSRYHQQLRASQAVCSQREDSRTKR